MAVSPPREAPDAQELAALDAIQRRVLWLATRMIDYANHERPKGDELKVGGHQASSASLVTALRTPITCAMAEFLLTMVGCTRCSMPSAALRRATR